MIGQYRFICLPLIYSYEEKNEYKETDSMNSVQLLLSMLSYS